MFCFVCDRRLCFLFCKVGPQSAPPHKQRPAEKATPKASFKRPKTTIGKGKAFKGAKGAEEMLAAAISAGVPTVETCVCIQCVVKYLFASACCFCFADACLFCRLIISCSGRRCHQTYLARASTVTLSAARRLYLTTRLRPLWKSNSGLEPSTSKNRCNRSRR